MKYIGWLINDGGIYDPSFLTIQNVAKDYNCQIVPIYNNRTANSKMAEKISVLCPRLSSLKSAKEYYKSLDLYKELIKKYKPAYTISPTKLKQQYHKLTQVKLVQKFGFLAPNSFAINNYSDAKKVAKKLGFPMVVKEIHGYGGQGVFLARNETELKELIKKDKLYLGQEFIKLKKIEDFRVYIIDGKTVGGLKRSNNTKGEFRANTMQGASAKFFMPEKKLANLAEQIAKKLGNKIVAIDFIKKGSDYYFVEFNNAFSIKADNEPKKIIVAKKLLEYLLKIAK